MYSTCAWHMYNTCAWHMYNTCVSHCKHVYDYLYTRVHHELMCMSHIYMVCACMCMSYIYMVGVCGYTCLHTHLHTHSSTLILRFTRTLALQGW